MLQRLNDRGGHRQLFYTVDFILFYLAGEDLVQTCHVIDVSPKGFALLVNNEEMGLIVGDERDTQPYCRHLRTYARPPRT